MAKLNSFLKKTLQVSLLFLAVHGSSVFAQDPQFSQFYANPIYINPAFAGTQTVGRIVTNVRQQWPGIPGSFRTGTISYDEHFDAINGGFGVQAMFDEQGIGTLRTVSLNLMYSYQIPITRKFTMRAAVQAGITQKSVDFSKLTWYDQIVLATGFVNPPSEGVYLQGGNLNPSIYLTNFAAGITGYSKNFYFGLAAHNIFEPTQDFFATADVERPNIIPRRFTGNVGLVIPLVESRNPKYQSNLYPNVVVKSQRQFQQLNLGLYASRGSFLAGLYYRANMQNSDAAIILLGIRTPKVRIGYSYDATLSEARPGAANSHEVSFAFELNKKVRKKTVRAMRCPDF
ncbi:MAG: PorP/SprF family type IX secretion system membrane protein [Bacteroidetes bacterium]|nr:PorP/SprF family type IX secretion system membrane protein [Bacteroidota bacterium]MCK6612100.1 PorP/SprF family type IX secretion system membrane protein [Bacteroidia bacterium]